MTKASLEKRKLLILAQLRHTANLIKAADQQNLNLSDDGCDYLKAALALSRDLIDEYDGGAYVDKASIRDYACDGVCMELLASLLEDGSK